MLQLDNRPEEHWAYLRNPNDTNKKLAIFVHGFQGNYLSTWGRLPSLLEQNAETDPDFAPWDFLFSGYATKTIESYLDIAGLLQTQIANALAGTVGFHHPYESLALFGNSLGTLGIRQLLCDWNLHPPGLLSKIHSITFFGSPLNGSSLAQLGGIFGLWPILDGLKPNSPQLRMLSDWTRSAHPHQGWPAVNVITGLDDQVVGSISQFVNWAGDKTPYKTTNFDHTDMKKPNAWDNSTVIGEIRQAL